MINNYGVILRNTKELVDESRSLRTNETVTRAIGGFALGIGVFLTAATAGNIAHSGSEYITNTQIILDVLFTGGGSALFSYSSSIGRNASIIDAEILRRDDQEITSEQGN